MTKDNSRLLNGYKKEWYDHYCNCDIAKLPKGVHVGVCLRCGGLAN